jgi:hypothetical protein
MNTITEIASRLASLCSDHKFIDAYNELFSEHAVSIDPVYKNEPLTGLAGLLERERQFLANNDIDEIKISDPLFAGNYFTVTLSMVFTPKGQESKKVEELCVYKVENGKIASQQFFIG